MSTLNIYRLLSLPVEPAASSVYIVPSGIEDLVDLYVTGDDKSVVYRTVGIPDIQAAIQTALGDYVPNESAAAGKLVNPLTLNLTGDVTGTATFDGSEGQVTLNTTVVNSGGGGAPAEIPEGTLLAEAFYTPPEDPLDYETIALNLFANGKYVPKNLSTQGDTYFTLPKNTVIRLTGSVTAGAIDAEEVSGFQYGTWDVNLTMICTGQNDLSLVEDTITSTIIAGDYAAAPWELTINTRTGYGDPDGVSDFSFTLFTGSTPTLPVHVKASFQMSYLEVPSA